MLTKLTSDTNISQNYDTIGQRREECFVERLQGINLQCFKNMNSPLRRDNRWVVGCGLAAVFVGQKWRCIFIRRQTVARIPTICAVSQLPCCSKLHLPDKPFNVPCFIILSTSYLEFQQFFNMAYKERCVVNATSSWEFGKINNNYKQNYDFYSLLIHGKT